ncbi:SpoIIE family protein phosphatase [Synechocystis sp. LEGE 06083]|uniref:PP2C family protein-serine/threonine phosphatase n=1 Tax=Synechocystis sp. LEGE 06083 TaxID=915336 RepID=UPI00187EB9BF|nr:SpoIIE family protein phosphatase [Synechocystis sp. LEGE 06083]MBE9195200.1 SpoIIE family protein phosphatase [Synechocystis sp. LEGE 06083]
MKLIQPFMQSIRFRIVGLLLLCLIPPTLGGIFLIDSYTGRQLKKIAEKDLQSRARLITQLISRADRERQQSTAFVASEPVITEFNVEESRYFLNEFVKFHQWNGFFVVANQEGELVAGSDGANQEKELPLKRWFEEVKEAKRHVNRLFPGKTYAESKDCLIVPIHNKNDQTQIGIVVGCVPLPIIADFVQKILKDAELERILLVNYQGYVYADTDIKNYSVLENRKNSLLVNQLLNNQGGFVYSQGRFSYLSPVHLRGTKTWGLIVENSESDIQTAILNVNRIGYLLLLVIGVIVAYASWSVVHHSTIPILELTKASQAIAEGNLNYPITVQGKDEIGILGNSFIHMRNQIKTLIAQEIKDGMNRLELEKGRQIQQNFLPISLPQLPQWQINAVFEPARTVSGDFYDAFLLGNGYLAIVIGDVCDKGVGAAMFMGLFRSLLRVFSGETMPGDTCIRDVNYKCSVSDSDDKKKVIVQFLNAVRLTNDYIATEHGDMAMFATLFFGVIDISNGNLSYINAGHEPVFILNSEGIKHKLKSTSPAVGMMPDSTFTIDSLTIDPGEILIGYTDGVTDARSPTKEFFGRKRLAETLTTNFSTGTKILDIVKQELISHIDGSIQFDDITMIAVYRN